MLNKNWILAEVGAAILLAWAIALWAGDTLVREQTFEQIRVAVSRGLLVYVTVAMYLTTLRRFAPPLPRLKIARVALRLSFAMFVGFFLRNAMIDFFRDSDFVGSILNASILATVWTVVLVAGWILPLPVDQPSPWTQRVEGRTLAWMLAGFTGFVVLAYFQDEWAISSFLWRLFDRDLLVVLLALGVAIDLHQKRQAYLRRSGVSSDPSTPEPDAAMSQARG